MATFKEAFAAGRAAFLKGGPKNFTWQGKSYSTDLASDTKKKPKAETAPPRRPKPPGAERPKARPANTGPSVMSEAPKQGKAPTADAQITTKKAEPIRKAAGTPFAPSRANPKVSPLGKSKGIGGRAAEAVKGFMSGFKINAGKNKTVAKAPNRADVGKAKKK